MFRVIQTLGYAVRTFPLLLKLMVVMLKRFPLMLHVQYDASKEHTVYKAISKSGLVPTKKLLP